MRQIISALFLILSCTTIIMLVSCSRPSGQAQGTLFKDDLEFLKQHTSVLTLTGQKGQALVAVNPDIQGRVMTSSAAGPDGLSFGWINRELIASGENDPHINAFGGEDRFWLGPEGGQYSLFFKKDSPFDLEHWFTPPPINEGAFELVSQDDKQVVLAKDMNLVNYSDFEFKIKVDRVIRLLEQPDLEALGVPVDGRLQWVAFQSDNRITNAGDLPWKKETGLVSIWILGMFSPSPETTIVIPYKTGTEEELGPVVNDAYFGKVPPDRLKIADGVIYFKGDGQYRSKIGISPLRVLPFCGSYDARNRVLTIVHLTLPENPAEHSYVNSMWEIQKDPYAGDVVNSYNDGPASPGAKPFGPFYELETSSPGAILNPGEWLRHVHTTIHLQGEEKDLDPIARKIFGVSLAEIKKAFSQE
ncbi:MAG: hypothetical protein NUW07_09770 [Candidatus Saccharicenans sp.]|jgi:hypothetical protein|nr:hypothetical protein [Candidatus Saccharicenans sp.]MDH7493668.1 hypothetical protein [Candidatus Saccharicenans sp.]